MTDLGKKFKEAEPYFRTAIKRLTWKNPNPYNSEAYYLLGLDLCYLGREDEAYDAFYKAAWSNEQQEMSLYYMAALAAKKVWIRMEILFAFKQEVQKFQIYLICRHKKEKF